MATQVHSVWTFNPHQGNIGCDVELRANTRKALETKAKKFEGYGCETKWETYKIIDV